MTSALSTRDVAVFPQTKFHRPAVRDEHVERALLLDAIEASGARIVVVTAPPGYGKSTLLAQWSERCADPSASRGCRSTPTTAARGCGRRC